MGNNPGARAAPWGPRLQVRAVDAAKRTWGDKPEWKSTLLSLAEKGELE